MVNEPRNTYKKDAGQTKRNEEFGNKAGELS